MSALAEGRLVSSAEPWASPSLCHPPENCKHRQQNVALTVCAFVPRVRAVHFPNCVLGSCGPLDRYQHAATKPVLCLSRAADRLQPRVHFDQVQGRLTKAYAIGSASQNGHHYRQMSYRIKQLWLVVGLCSWPRFCRTLPQAFMGSKAVDVGSRRRAASGIYTRRRRLTSVSKTVIWRASSVACRIMMCAGFVWMRVQKRSSVCAFVHAQCTPCAWLAGSCGQLAKGEPSSWYCHVPCLTSCPAALLYSVIGHVMWPSPWLDNSCV